MNRVCDQWQFIILVNNICLQQWSSTGGNCAHRRTHSAMSMNMGALITGWGALLPLVGGGQQCSSTSSRAVLGTDPQQRTVWPQMLTVLSGETLIRSDIPHGRRWYLMTLRWSNLHSTYVPIQFTHLKSKGNVVDVRRQKLNRIRIYLHRYIHRKRE